MAEVPTVPDREAWINRALAVNRSITIDEVLQDQITQRLRKTMTTISTLPKQAARGYYPAQSIVALEHLCKEALALGFQAQKLVDEGAQVDRSDDARSRQVSLAWHAEMESLKATRIALEKDIKGKVDSVLEAMELNRKTERKEEPEATTQSTTAQSFPEKMRKAYDIRGDTFTILNDDFHLFLSNPTEYDSRKEAKKIVKAFLNDKANVAAHAVISVAPVSAMDRETKCSLPQELLAEAMARVFALWYCLSIGALSSVGEVTTTVLPFAELGRAEIQRDLKATTRIYGVTKSETGGGDKASPPVKKQRTAEPTRGARDPDQENDPSITEPCAYCKWPGHELRGADGVINCIKAARADLLKGTYRGKRYSPAIVFKLPALGQQTAETS